MTNRDFDQSDAEVLAEFAPFEVEWDEEERMYVAMTPIECDGIREPFRPWSESASMWQRQLLLEAVREKGLKEEFNRKFEQSNTELTETLDKWDYIEAPPEAICESILSFLEGE